ncbi:hypothetical protein DMA12_20900 [Amycolatopsis balhimycina DSM 5908]|uniref:Uncharacterized protein n=1 Tax=Amycolatopsis balhimycina DSM 5908 TaxID=1081091 RepID=A0A428WHX6_AMYBA|nr:hypothetical protein [Amycolatopsis balhimycina]RSM42681.1 hypothetical protein DMA12_20900 [Amycolatopsis balhimycina DSM 5908]
MAADEASASPDRNALVALALAVLGVAAGVFAFKLHLRGGDEKLFTYSLGLACTGFYMSSLGKAVKALRARTAPAPGASGTARILATAAVVTLAAAIIFTFSSVLANYLSKFGNLSGVEIAVGLVASVLPFLGPLLLAAFYFYSLQQSLCDAGWNMAAALLAALVCAGGSVAVWYGLNIYLGPLLYRQLGLS